MAAQGPAGPRRDGPERRYVLAVLAGVLLANLGVWNAGVPWADEVGQVVNGLAVLRGVASNSLYVNAYALLLSRVTTDPFVAHVILRFIASVASTLGLYFVLRSFRGVRPAAVVIACLVWTSSKLCVPHVQDAPSHVFCFALILPALALLLRRPSALTIVFFMLSAFVASRMRPEYLASLLLVPLGGLLLMRARRSAGARASLTRGRHRIATIVTALVLAACVLFARSRPSSSGTGFSAYLLLGLGQCYAVFYQERHPQEQFTPMTEYVPLLNRVFGNPHTFAEAVTHNPSEFIRYVAINTAQNLAKLPRGVLSSRNKLYSALVLLMLVAGTAFGLRDLLRARRGRGPALPAAPGTLRFELLILLLLASASSTAIVLLIPNARYWISWTPLFYLWMAWSIDQILRVAARMPALVPNAGVPDGIVLPMAVLIFGFPVFVGFHSDKSVVYAVRAALADPSRRPVIAGDWVLPLATFAFRDQALVVSTAGLGVEGLKNRTYDAFVGGPSEATAFAADNRPFLEAFAAAPESYGYRLLPLPLHLVDFSVYLKTP